MTAKPLVHALTVTPETLDSVADIDADLDVGAPTPNSADDQATRLRNLIEAQGARLTLPEAQDDLPVSPRVQVPTTVPTHDHSAKIICVASGKGGVGKTNVAVNLAIALAARGLRVTLLDADLGTANADVICGLMPHARLEHVFAPAGLDYHDAGRRTIRDILVNAPGGFRLVPGSAGIARMADLGAGERRGLLSALNDLEQDADVVLVDAAAGVGRMVTSFVGASDLCLIVTSPEPTSIADAYALIKCVVMRPTHGFESPHGDLALILNQVTDFSEASSVHSRLAAVCNRFLGLDLPLAGWIAQDLRVPEAVRARKPFLLRSPKTPASRNISETAAHLALQMGLVARGTPPPPRTGRLAAALHRLVGF